MNWIQAAKILTALKMRKVDTYAPYDPQLEFHSLSSTKRERALFAGNQLGKTLAAGYELMYHATGDYPDWWEGKRFPGPTLSWACGSNNETTRDNNQKILLGEGRDWGTGTIPKSALAEEPTMARGFPDLVDRVKIRHKSGGISVIQFKAYDQKRKAFEGASVNGVIWLDEEPPEDIYQECMARISARGGIIMMTFTPLQGMSDVVSMFFPEPESAVRSITMLTIDDVTHMDPFEKAIIIEGYSEADRLARTRGEPMLGEGAVFRGVPRSSYEIDPFKIPDHFAVGGGIDFGYGDHPFGGIKAAWDRDDNTIYVTNEYREKKPEPAVHVAALKEWGEDTLFHWPHDGNRQWGESGPVIDVYRKLGLRVWREHAHFKNRLQGTKTAISPEAAVQVALSKMQIGKMKIFATCPMLLQEMSMYHRKNGLLVQKKDDLISAWFKALMMQRFWRTPSIAASAPPSSVDSEWDEFAFGE